MIPHTVLTEQIPRAIDEALADVPDWGRFDEGRWPDVFMEVIRPLIGNMRDVRRYAASLHGTVQALDGKVALVDVLALEAVRGFLPDVFAAVTASQEALTSPWQGVDTNHRRESHFKAAIDALLDAVPEKREVATALIARVFPAALHHIRNEVHGPESLKTWLRERRAAHADVLTYYLEHVAGERLKASWQAEHAVHLLADRERFDTYMRSLDPSVWKDVISALGSYQDEFPAEAAEPATIVLLNLMAEIPDRPRSVLDVDAEFVVWRVVLRLLRRLPTPEAIERVVRSALPGIATLSGKLALLQLVGYEENADHEHISQSGSLELASSLRDEVRAATPETLATEPDLIRLLLWTKRTTEPSEPGLDLPKDPVFACALLKSAVTEERSQAMGTRVVRREKRLRWDSLVELVGGEDGVRRVVDACRGQGEDTSLAEAVELAEKYLSGWKPDRC